MSSTSPRVDAAAGGGDAGLGRRQLIATVAWAAAIAVAARLQFSLPGTDIPQTAQTLAVLLAGAFLGFTRGTFAVGIYLLAGALGLPVFADGASGVSTLLGPSGGYLIGFWVAAAITGYAADRGVLGRPLVALLAMLGGHAVILAVGATLLAARVGFVAAWFNGVAPFLPGAVAKSVVAAILVVLVARLLSTREVTP